MNSTSSIFVMNHSATQPGKQQGVALVVSLVFLLLLTIIGLATMRSTTLQESMANNVQDRMMAFEAAEAALRAGERNVASYTGVPDTTTTNPGNNQVWELNAVDWASQSGTWWNTNTIGYSAALENISAAPHYAIEFQSFVPNGLGTGINYGAPSGRYYYRVTTRTTGPTGDAVVLLQSTTTSFK